MEHYLVTYTVTYDGLEHSAYGLVEAKSLDEAQGLADSEEGISYFGWEDMEEETNIEVSSVRKLTPEELPGVRLIATLL